MGLLDNLKKLNPTTPAVPLKPLTPATPFGKKAEPVTTVSSPSPASVPEQKKAFPLVKKSPFGGTPVAPVEAETTPVVETVPETTEVTAITEVTETTPVVEVKKKGPAKKAIASSKSDEKIKDSGPEDSVTDQGFVEIPTSDDMPFGDAIKLFNRKFSDAEWDSYEEEIRLSIDAIEIEADMNTGTLKAAASKIDKVHDKIWYELQAMKSASDYFDKKEPEGYIERIKKINIQGGNDLERKKAGIMAAMSHMEDGKRVNLFELADAVRQRYNFLVVAEQKLQFKRLTLITMNGALKIEN